MEDKQERYAISEAASLKGAATWLERLNQSVTKFANLADEKRVSRFRNELQDSIQQLIPSLTQLSGRFDPAHFVDGLYRFEHGELPSWLEEESKQLKILSHKGAQATAKIADLIAERVKEAKLLRVLLNQRWLNWVSISNVWITSPKFGA